MFVAGQLGSHHGDSRIGNREDIGVFFGRHEPDEIFATEFKHGLIPRNDEFELWVGSLHKVNQGPDVLGLVGRK